MYVNVNGKLTKVTREEYENMLEEKGNSPLTKMDELINAILSVEEAISHGGGGEGGDNTTYRIAIEGNTIILTGSDGSIQNIELPEVPGSVLSQSWNEETKEYELTLANGDIDSSVQIQYHLIKNIEANQIVLMAGDKPVDAIQLAQDQDTKYTIEKVGNEIRLIPSDGSAAIPIELDPDLNTTYELSFNGETDILTLTPNDNSLPQNISLAKYADAEAVEDALAECVDKDDYTEDMAKKADKSEIPDVSDFVTNEDLIIQNNALKAQIDILNKFIKDIKYPDIENMDIDMDISASGKDIAISGSVSNGVRNINNASSVIAEDINIESARLSISAEEDVEITNLTTTGTLEKSVSNATISINNSGFVTIKDSTVNQKSYNAIEIGLSTNVPPKNILIDNINFTGNLGNNAITIFGWQSNAEIVISNCVFDKCSNPIRLSNKTNVPAKVKFINCTCNEWDSNPDYAGFLLLQDYISSSAEEAETANRFANIEITFENCYGPTAKIEGNAETLSDPTNQVVYLWRDKGGKVAYDAAKFPKIIAY